MRAPLTDIPIRAICSRFWPFAAPRRRWLVLALFLSLIPPAVESVEIWLFKVVVDDVLIPRNYGLFPKVAAAFVALMLLSSIISGARRMVSTWLSQRFLIDLRLHVMRHLETLSLAFFQRSRLGDLLSRMSADISAIETFMLSSLTGLVTSLLQLVFFVGALFYLQWKLAVIALVVTPVFWFTARRFSRRIKTLSREKQKLTGLMSSVVEQTLSNVALVQAYDQAHRHVERLRRVLERKYDVEMSSSRLKTLYTPAVDLTELIGEMLVIGSGVWLMSRGELTVGGLLAFLAFLNQLYGPVRDLGGLANSAYAASAGAERVIEVLDEQPLVQERPGAVDVGQAGRVQVQHVSFHYPNSPEPVLRDVSFEVKAGETVAIVGASGAGKSSLGRLLVRFYDPDHGQVLLDDNDIRDVTLTSLRRNIAVLLQETLVFDGTIRDNIMYGAPEASEEEVLNASRAADAHDFILSLPDGYDTQIGERGSRLSGGQAQRVAIARAMLRRAPFLLLDEPTTGLDANSTDNVLQPLRRLMHGRATIIISHNLTTVREASTVLVLDHGSVVERGTHDELLRAGGRYAELWHTSGLNGSSARVAEVMPLKPVVPPARRASADGPRDHVVPGQLAPPRRAKNDETQPPRRMVVSNG